MEANLHPLDAVYDRYWTHAMSRPPLNELFSEVRKEAMRITRDADAAQQVCIYVLENLERFSRVDASSFSRWIRRIAKLRRKALSPSLAQKTIVAFDEELHSDLAAVDDYREFDRLPSDLRDLALALEQGDSLQEIARLRNVTVDALQKKVRRHVRKMASRSLYHQRRQFSTHQRSSPSLAAVNQAA